MNDFATEFRIDIKDINELAPKERQPLGNAKGRPSADDCIINHKLALCLHEELEFGNPAAARDIATLLPEVLQLGQYGDFDTITRAEDLPEWFEVPDKTAAVIFPVSIICAEKESGTPGIIYNNDILLLTAPEKRALTLQEICAALKPVREKVMQNYDPKYFDSLNIETKWAGLYFYTHFIPYGFQESYRYQRSYEHYKEIIKLPSRPRVVHQLYEFLKTDIEKERWMGYFLSTIVNEMRLRFYPHEREDYTSDYTSLGIRVTVRAAHFSPANFVAHIKSIYPQYLVEIKDVTDLKEILNILWEHNFIELQKNITKYGAGPEVYARLIPGETPMTVLEQVAANFSLQNIPALAHSYYGQVGVKFKYKYEERSSVEQRQGDESWLPMNIARFNQQTEPPTQVEIMPENPNAKAESSSSPNEIKSDDQAKLAAERAVAINIYNLDEKPEEIKRDDDQANFNQQTEPPTQVEIIPENPNAKAESSSSPQDTNPASKIGLFRHPSNRNTQAGDEKQAEIKKDDRAKQLAAERAARALYNLDEKPEEIKRDDDQTKKFDG